MGSEKQKLLEYTAEDSFSQDADDIIEIDVFIKVFESTVLLSFIKFYKDFCCSLCQVLPCYDQIFTHEKFSLF